MARGGQPRSSHAVAAARAAKRGSGGSGHVAAGSQRWPGAGQVAAKRWAAKRHPGAARWQPRAGQLRVVPQQPGGSHPRGSSFCACNTICGGHKPSQLLRRPGDSQEVVTSQEATIWRPGEVVAKRWPTSGSQEARWPPAKRQSSGHRWQRRGQVLVPRAVVKWEPEVAPSQAVAKWPRSLILKWLLNMLRQ